ncbi:hypothetical protein GCM10027568_35970 [Humibacter soli]
MTTIYDCNDPEQRVDGLAAAREAISRGELVVIPTDTVYGIAADASDAAAVQRLRDAKGSGRSAPPAVLVSEPVAINSVASRVPGAVHQLTPRFWPGALTVVLQALPTLGWDLGDSNGTIAVRMPADELALELLRDTGPLAVSSANTAGTPAATSTLAAFEALGDTVAVYLDGGDVGTELALPSTILDATPEAGTGHFRVLRHGAISIERLRIVLGDDAVIDATAGSEEPVPTD